MAGRHEQLSADYAASERAVKEKTEQVTKLLLDKDDIQSQFFKLSTEKLVCPPVSCVQA